jgi:hypothetical protein
MGMATSIHLGRHRVGTRVKASNRQTRMHRRGSLRLCRRMHSRIRMARRLLGMVRTTVVVHHSRTASSRVIKITCRRHREGRCKGQVRSRTGSKGKVRVTDRMAVGTVVVSLHLHSDWLVEVVQGLATVDLQSGRAADQVDPGREVVVG